MEKLKEQWEINWDKMTLKERFKYAEKLCNERCEGSRISKRSKDLELKKIGNFIGSHLSKTPYDQLRDDDIYEPFRHFDWWKDAVENKKTKTVQITI